MGITSQELTIRKNGRIAWIDNVRFFAIICVIFYHSSSLVVDVPFNFNSIIESFNMALFFFLSGLTSYYSISKVKSVGGWTDFFKKKFVRIMLPCIFVSLLIFRLYIAFWFLETLFYYLIAFVSIHLLCDKLRISPNYAIILFLLLVFIDVPKVANEQEFVLSFALGTYFAKNNILEKIEDKPNRTVISIIIAGFVIWLILLPMYKSFYYYPFGVLLQERIIWLFIIRQAIELTFAVSCCLLFMIACNRYTMFSSWGGQTLGLYIIHASFHTILCQKNMYIDAHGQIWGYFAQIGIFIVLTTISMMLVKLFERWELSKLLVLGGK